nr:redoxin domain-containing protein [Thalassobacillus sp. CUG 92003]
MMEQNNQSDSTRETTVESNEPQNSTSEIKKGSPAPEFRLKRLNGETVSLSDYEGEKIMINFWATWCPPCRAEMPDMEKLYKETDIEILAVNLTGTEDSRGDVNQFVNELELSFPILLDQDSSIMAKYKVSPVPTSIFVDENGTIQSVMLGAMNYDMMIKRYEEL